MLTFCSFLLLCCSTPRAQSNVEYNFRQQSTIVGDRFSTDEDDAPQPTLNCLAANGYGQWTMSNTAGTGTTGEPTSTEFVKGWYLLANGLYKPSVKFVSGDPTFPGCDPPGVVQSGAFTGNATPSEALVTANMNGTVDYVWPDRLATGTPFVISQFTTTDVNISFSFLTNPTPPMDVVTSPIHNATPEIPTIDPCPGWITPPFCFHDVISTSPPQDEFCVASDASFLYIVWCSTTNECVSPVPQIWATVVDLATLTTVSGWQQEIGNGIKPTIACDPRNNRGMSPLAAFEVAWLVVSPTPIIKRISCVANSLGAAFSLPGTYINPNTGATKFWNSVSHARILVNSAATSNPVTAVYAIVNDEDATNALIFYQPATSAATAASYVDGAVMLTRASPITGTGVVMDNFITAFANPYDVGDVNSGSGPDQFHCLYQFSADSKNPLLIVQGADNGELHPSHPTDTRLVLNEWSGTLENDPVSYVGAVNQMGIHVHWLSDSAGSVVHNYARDMNRTFNENIEENTLVTDQCTVSGGGSVLLQDNTRMAIWTDPNYGADLSDHTGDIGLWQPGTLFPVGGFLDPHVGTLNFTGNNTVLQIGGTGAFDGGADLTDIPYFYCNFDDEATGQGITVGPSSTFDYYGFIASHNSDGSIHVNGIGEPLLSSPFLSGRTDAMAGSGIITLHGSGDGGYANLNIHGGADFDIGDGGEFLSNFEGNIQVLYDGNVYPLPPATPRHLTGHATLHGTTYIEESYVEGQIPADSEATIVSILGYLTLVTSTPQFLSGGTSYYNGDDHGVSEIQIAREFKPPYASEFDTDEFIAARIHDIDPENDDPTNLGLPGSLTVDNSWFDEQHGRSIFVESTEDPEGGSTGTRSALINIFSNVFDDIDTHDRITDPDNSTVNGLYGIYIKGLDASMMDGDASLAGLITVTGNTFTDNNWNNVNPDFISLGTPNFANAAAICFENTTGNIIGNTISDPAYTNGIWLKATIPTALHDGILYTIPPTERTFICSNTISELHTPSGGSTSAPPNMLTGIRTNFHDGGFVKLNTITDCEIGYSSGGGTTTGTGMLFNTIDNTHNTISWDISNAIVVTANSSGNKLDLSGIHNTGVNDEAGFNTAMATYTDWTTGLVTVDCNAIFNVGSTLGLITCPACVNFGQNNLRLLTAPLPGGLQPTASEVDIIKGVCSTGASALNNVDVNFWGLDGASIDPNNGTGADPENWNAALGSSQVNSIKVTYSFPVPHTLGAASSFSGVNCGTSRAVTKLKGMKTQSNDTIDTCLYLYGRGLDADMEAQWQSMYDTLQLFVQRCPTNQYAYTAFGGMATAVSYGGNGPAPGSYQEFQSWLISALAWNPGNAQYFCADVQALIGTTETGDSDTTWQQSNTETNRAMSVLYWMLHNPLCTNADDSELYYESRGSQIGLWLETQDTATTPFDSTIYTMQQLGLDSVLKYAGLLGVSNNTPSIISNATAYPNPTGEGTVISFGIAREAYVSINLYDVLGHQVSSSGFGGVVEPGNLSVPMSLVGLPAGTYFARIQTTYGETQTVKLVKE